MNTPLWAVLLVGAVPALIAFFGAITLQRRRSDAVAREQNRREDQLWGYRDSNGVLHEGLSDTVTRLVRISDDLKRAGDDVIERLGRLEKPSPS